MDPFEKSDEVKDTELTAGQSRLIKVARISTFYHLALVPILIFFGNFLVSLIDKIGDWMGMSPINTGANDFWMVPVIGLAFTLAFCSFRVWRNVQASDWMQPVVFVHGILAVSYLVYFYIDISSLAYLLAMILELALFAVIGYFWWTGRGPSAKS